MHITQYLFALNKNNKHIHITLLRLKKLAICFTTSWLELYEIYRIFVGYEIFFIFIIAISFKRFCLHLFSDTTTSQSRWLFFSDVSSMINFWLALNLCEWHHHHYHHHRRRVVLGFSFRIHNWRVSLWTTSLIYV